MKILLLLVFATRVCFAAVDLNAVMPELTLKDGRTLKKVVFVSYSSTAVMAKWDGGRGTLSYDVLPAEIAKAAHAHRPAPTATTKKVVSPAPDPAISRGKAPKPASTAGEARTLSGQVFITTRGRGAYAFAGASILAFPRTALEEAQRTQRAMVSGVGATPETAPRHYEAWLKALVGIPTIGTATADSEGKYSMQVSHDGPIFLFCYTTRLVGGFSEYNLWVVPSTGSGTLNLDGTNSLF